MSESVQPSGWKFQFVRIYTYICPAILYAFVSFQKQCPSVVVNDMAKAYNVSIDSFGSFSSIYFYPYACMQPFAGLIADIIDPAYVVGVSGLIAACGSIICGLSNSMGIGILGRLLVGLGCGPTYVSTVRIITKWFKSDYYPAMFGILVAMSGAGGMLASGALGIFLEHFKWRYAFYGVGGIGGFLALIVLIFVRGDPRKKGFAPVNDEGAPVDTIISCGDKLSMLWQNIVTIFKNWMFWPITLYNITSSCPYIDIVGLWGGPYLIYIRNFSKKEKGNTLLAISIGMVVGSLTVPYLSKLLKTKKWICTGSSLIVLVDLLLFFFLGNKFSKIVIWILFLIIGYFTAPLCSVSYPLR
ncbi:Major Facilitator Superfamily protein [Trichomonas vaginalis G3]|uniref:Lysosomal dipeptide transporter MFSD1 n=1 Tax=Trichomonas vaginalis (strain ATCC PRA-98 / G3) TaxID=412133 RepID=A2EUU7_TRIV3|nr:major facilitator superfamily transporter [Trichomonas vaginalis G3]EAY03556.1 Major Facilitator Superfamily protein [Trichomonas vaginalis G3]KAI5550057.1 Major Facilitator Superfamily [Trichomonas vaginalis G3]|eukprot:XP_001315779.1 major facilitator superfamily transporter [Trichomonas vaginalis G3]